MTDQKLTELLRYAYQWGRDNGSNRSEKNFNDFLQTEAAKQALSLHNVVNRRELLIAFMESLTTEHLTEIEIAEFDKVADRFLGN